ncbi:Putative methyltransferase [Flavobacterium longum]|uniref:class I SAM-dependent methyltransferase n=1 Tax=Flavobacterium longum TaxID=1299340 RepID=UPI0039EA2612
MTREYDRIGKSYDSSRCADPYLTARLLDLIQPEAHGKYLDIGCGTGNYTAALRNKGLDIVGVEPSEVMLETARLRHAHMNWISGAAEAIPFPPDTFLGAIATLTIHHWNALEKGFAEISRVLKPKGRWVVFTSWPAQMKGYWLNHYFPAMLAASIAQMPSLDAIALAGEKSGLTVVETEKYHVADDLQDGFLYIGKHKPEMYFDTRIRNGISSFASLAHQDEVNAGLAQLRLDIDTGCFESVRKRYENALGDYLFIVLEKAI